MFDNLVADFYGVSVCFNCNPIRIMSRLQDCKICFLKIATKKCNPIAIVVYMVASLNTSLWKQMSIPTPKNLISWQKDTTTAVHIHKFFCAIYTKSHNTNAFIQSTRNANAVLQSIHNALTIRQIYLTQASGGTEWKQSFLHRTQWIVSQSVDFRARKSCSPVNCVQGLVKAGRINFDRGSTGTAQRGV